LAWSNGKISGKTKQKPQIASDFEKNFGVRGFWHSAVDIKTVPAAQPRAAGNRPVLPG